MGGFIGWAGDIGRTCWFIVGMVEKASSLLLGLLKASSR